MGLSNPVGLIVDREVIESVSVNLVQAGTSGRTADRGLSQRALGMVLQTIDGNPGIRKHKMEYMWLGLMHNERNCCTHKALRLATVYLNGTVCQEEKAVCVTVTTAKGKLFQSLK